MILCQGDDDLTHFACANCKAVRNWPEGLSRKATDVSRSGPICTDCEAVVLSEAQPAQEPTRERRTFAAAATRVIAAMMTPRTA